MPNHDLDQELTHRLDELRANGSDHISSANIRDIVENVLSTMDGDVSGRDVKLYADIQSLSGFIARAKSELAELRPEAIAQEHIPAATDELDAVISATEEATNAIMEAAETIEETAEKLGGEDEQRLSQATTLIYEACSFQDITGQRISKVVNALREIEEKVEEMIAAFGDDAEAKEKVRRRKEAREEERNRNGASDKELLQGPQLTDGANDQDAIDALLSGTD